MEREAAEVEVGGVPEPLPVPEAAGSALDFPNL